MNYEKLKVLFQTSEDDFAKLVNGDARTQKQIIKVLADADNDNGWPLAMLRVISPKLSDALRYWSAGGYEKIRRAQEDGVNHKHATAMHNELHYLPKWDGRVTHVSKDATWYSVFANGRHQLRSFLSCCGSNGSFAYVSHPEVTLVIEHPKSARLIGSLTTENCEHEVIFPKGTIFRLERIDRLKKQLYVAEEGSAIISE